MNVGRRVKTSVIRSDGTCLEYPAEASEATVFWLQLTTPEAIDLASGYVPTGVIAKVRAMLDWMDEDERNARCSEQREATKPRIRTRRKGVKS